MTRPTIEGLRAAYASGSATPARVVAEAYARIGARGDDAVWVHLVPLADALARCEELERARAGGVDLPLFGIPFAVKDNIDVAGIPTTAACPAFAYTPARHAEAVRRLLDAGAVLVGKTNLDQFATGLVGTRSPFGAPRCVYNPEYVSGGSSSGSAVAVALGAVAFALGTDTAGSGRVPAAFNGIVGLKPTRGLVSTRGVVPACRSLDCVSVFAHGTGDALAVLDVLEGYDEADPYSRARPGGAAAARAELRFGVPRASDLAFFGDAEAAALFAAAVARLTRLGGTPVEVDLAPFREAAELLYAGPWVAERDAAVGDFLRRHPGAAHPVVRTIVQGAARFSATDAFRAQYRLEELRRVAAGVWSGVEVLALPTTGTIYRVAEVLAEPYALNATLGHYTNFMNLLDLCGVAVPAGFRANRTPFGITLAAPAFHDRLTAELAGRYEESYHAEVEAPPLAPAPAPAGIRLAVVGAHLSGEPLNHQLTSRGARLVRSCRTAPEYRLFALAGTAPAKPGLVRVGHGGQPVELEVWELAVEAFGSFVEQVPAPLAIGTVQLEDGSAVKGFLCEPRATVGAEDITRFGGWRAFRRAAARAPSPAAGG